MSTFDSVSDESKHELCGVVDEMTQSMASVRELIKSLRDKQANTANLDTRDGISLLSLKHHTLLSYLQSLALLSAHRAIGHSLAARTTPAQPFSSHERGSRGAEAGDLVDSMVEGRIVLEKIKALEGRMKYQIEKLVRLAEEPQNTAKNVVDDPLAFRPNPQNLANAASDSEDDNDASPSVAHNARGDGIYRPPRLAPMPYTDTVPTARGEPKARRRAVPTALRSLADLDPSRPVAESTGGLGAAPASHLGGGGPAASARAREVRRMTEFEEENMTRLVMKKRDARQRARDEADIALGGAPSGAVRGGRGRGGGFEDEFGDVLRAVGRSTKARGGDGYEELRERGKREGVLGRSRKRAGDEVGEEDGGPGGRKRSRFEKEAKAARRRAGVKDAKRR